MFCSQIQIIKSKTVEGFKPEFSGVADAFSKVIKANGIRGAYQGFQATIIRNFWSGGTYFMVFDTLRINRAKVNNCTIKELPVLETFVCGGIAGVFYWGPYYPLDVIKSTM